MNVKVLHPSGEITEEILQLSIDFPTSGHMADSALGIVSQHTGRLPNLPIYFNDANVLENSDYINQYTNGMLKINLNNIKKLDGINHFQILMIEEQYQYFADTFNKVSCEFAVFSYEFNHLLTRMADRGASDDEIFYKRQEYMNRMPFEQNIEDWATIIAEMAESAKKEELEFG